MARYTKESKTEAVGQVLERYPIGSSGESAGASTTSAAGSGFALPND